MQPQAWPQTRDLVFIGGGHTAALVLRGWAMDPLPGVRLTVINPDPAAPYSGMLPGHIAGHYPRRQMMIDLVQLAHDADARIILGRAEGIDRTEARIHVPGRPPVAYDVAVLDIGIGTAPLALPGFAEHAVAAKPLGPFAATWARFLEDVGAGRAQARAAVLGAGVAGVELALAMDHRLRGAGAQPQITLIDRSAPLSDVAPRTRARLLAALAQAGIQVLAHRPPAAIEHGAVVLGDGARIAADFILGVAGARPQGWLSETGLALHEGFVRVRPSLQTESDAAILAAGDIAHLVHAPRPKAGVYAVRAAPVLAHNLRVLLSGQGRLRRFMPQRDYLKLISLGGARAVAERSGLVAEGAWAWRLKDGIDRRFMAMFHDRPAMPAPALPQRAALGLAEEVSGAPLCGGCGAKIGPAALRAGIAQLPKPNRDDVIAGAGDDAAVLAIGDGVQVISTDHMRMLVSDPYLMARLTALHALGDIWAMGAQPQAGLSQVILPRLSALLQARDLAQITAGLTEELTAAGAVLAGGHTTQGAEGVIGLTVTGLAPRALSKTGAMPGDALILTRPLGSGVVMAALMQPPAPDTLDPDGPMPGEAVAEALRVMLRSGAAAARILAPEARALTDVTGFGLAGHLGEMLRPDPTAGAAKPLRATLHPARLPLLPLAADLARAGVRAHLDAANRAGAPPVTGLADPGLATLLHDPQTAGGFLAVVPPDRAEAVLQALHRAGETAAAIIGRIEAAEDDADRNGGGADPADAGMIVLRD